LIKVVIVGVILIVYCMHKRKKEQEAGMEWNTENTGRNVELTGKRKAY
jgi:hypothetical protein